MNHLKPVLIPGTLVLLAVSSLLAFVMPGSTTRSALPPASQSIFLSSPANNATVPNETWFVVDFDRLRGLPGSPKTMRLTWYSDSASSDSQVAVMMGNPTPTLVECLPNGLGIHAESFEYPKPAGVAILIVKPGGDCPHPGGSTLGLVIELM